MHASILNCEISEVFKFSFAICAELTTAQSAVPDRTSTFPRISSNLSSCKMERTIRDARVDVNASIIVAEGEFLETPSVCRLTIISHSILIISCSRIRHILESLAIDICSEDSLSNKPVSLVNSLRGAFTPFLNHNTKDIYNRLIKSSTLEFIRE